MRIAGISLLIVLSTCGNSPHPARNVEALWKGVDVQSLPLQVQNLEEVREEGIVIRKLLYVSQLDGDFPARIIAYYGFPASQASAAPKGLPAQLLTTRSTTKPVSPPKLNGMAPVFATKLAELSGITAGTTVFPGVKLVANEGVAIPTSRSATAEIPFRIFIQFPPHDFGDS